jgi:DNA-directed RNA polymerase specialized sigma24 family protein
MGEVPERPNGEDLGRACQALKGPVPARARARFPTLSEPDLEDVFQSACLSVIRAEGPVENLRAYLHEAVHSHAVTELRRRGCRATVPLPEFDSAEPGAESPAARRLQESMIDEREPGPEERGGDRAAQGLCPRSAQRAESKAGGDHEASVGMEPHPS